MGPQSVDGIGRGSGSRRMGHRGLTFCLSFFRTIWRDSRDPLTFPAVVLLLPHGFHFAPPFLHTSAFGNGAVRVRSPSAPCPFSSPANNQNTNTHQQPTQCPQEQGSAAFRSANDYNDCIGRDVIALREKRIVASIVARGFPIMTMK